MYRYLLTSSILVHMYNSPVTACVPHRGHDATKIQAAFIFLPFYMGKEEKVKRQYIISNLVRAVPVMMTVMYCMAAVVAMYHQCKALMPKNHIRQVQITDNSIIFHQNSGEITITGYRVYPVTEMTQEMIDEEMYYDSLELLAICVEAEAANQGIEGKRLVADVILNRVDSPLFPDNITDVITQPYHFTSYWDGAMDRAVPTEETFQAVQMELDHRSNTEILYFTAGEWPEYGTKWKQVGDHYFAKE